MLHDSISILVGFQAVVNGADFLGQDSAKNSGMIVGIEGRRSFGFYSDLGDSREGVVEREV